MKPTIALLTWLLVSPALLAGQDPIDVDRATDAQKAACIDWVKTEAQSPVEYVVGKFAHHDVVLLGETHAIRDHCELVIQLLAPIYHRAGVRVLASEFVRTRDDERTNRLVTAEKYDAELAVELAREGPWPTWGYKEYLDILHAVWKLNRSLPPEAPRMRVVGIDSDWNQYALWFELNRAERFKVLLAREKNMVRVVETEGLAKKEKVLVHVGFSHTLTSQGLKLGTVLTKNHGAKIFQVGVHQKMGKGARLPGFLEDVLAQAGGKPVAFDIVGSPFAALRDRKCHFWRMKKNARFEDLMQGYLYLRPLADLRKVTWVEGFINDAMFEKANAVAVKMRWAKKGECNNAAELDRKMAEHFPGP